MACVNRPSSTSDQLVAEPLQDKTRHSQETHIHAPGGIGLFVCFWHKSPQWTRASSFMRFQYHTRRRTTVGRTPLDEWSARRRDLYLTTHNTHDRHIRTPGGIRIHNLSRQAAVDLSLRLRGHWDRHYCLLLYTVWCRTQIVLCQCAASVRSIRRMTTRCLAF
jgi:hypothetical protein